MLEVRSSSIDHLELAQRDPPTHRSAPARGSSAPDRRDRHRLQLGPPDRRRRHVRRRDHRRRRDEGGAAARRRPRRHRAARHAVDGARRRRRSVGWRRSRDSSARRAIEAVATSAVRDAANADQFVARVRQEADLHDPRHRRRGRGAALLSQRARALRPRRRTHGRDGHRRRLARARARRRRRARRSGVAPVRRAPAHRALPARRRDAEGAQEAAREVRAALKSVMPRATGAARR